MLQCLLLRPSSRRVHPGSAGTDTYRSNMIWAMFLPPVPGSHFIVCGDNPLAYRIARELTDRYGQYVVVLLADKLKNHGPQIAALPGVIVREHAVLDSHA